MLNQNYSYVGSKRNCRIALGMLPFLYLYSYFFLYIMSPRFTYLDIGPYSNPMCHVAEGFRCIVLMDSKKIDFTDPPFLNRFEKQSFKYLIVYYLLFVIISYLFCFIFIKA